MLFLFVVSGTFPRVISSALFTSSPACMHEVRESLGFCPQFDVLFDVMTVREHLWFFGRLKGLAGADLEQDVDAYVAKLGITAKQHAQVATLSGGQKRAVSVALALVGRPATVILDEPTSGGWGERNEGGII